MQLHFLFDFNVPSIMFLLIVKNQANSDLEYQSSEKSNSASEDERLQNKKILKRLRASNSILTFPQNSSSSNQIHFKYRYNTRNKKDSNFKVNKIKIFNLIKSIIMKNILNYFNIKLS